MVAKKQNFRFFSFLFEATRKFKRKHPKKKRQFIQSKNLNFLFKRFGSNAMQKFKAKKLISIFALHKSKQTDSSVAFFALKQNKFIFAKLRTLQSEGAPRNQVYAEAELSKTQLPRLHLPSPAAWSKQKLKISMRILNH